MRKIAALIFLIIFAAQFLHGQTFIKYLPDFRTNAYTIEESNNGNFLVGGYQPEEIFIAKFNNRGEIIWKVIKSFDNIINFKYRVLTVLNDGSVIFQSFQSDGIYITKITEQGSIVWETQTLSVTNILLLQAGVIEYADGTLLSFTMQNFPRDLLITKLSSDGNIQWQKSISFNGGLTNHLMLEKLNDNKIIAGQPNQLKILDSLATPLWEFNADQISSVLCKDESTMLISHRTGQTSHITEVDQNGNLINEYSFPYPVEDMIKLNRGYGLIITNSLKNKFVFTDDNFVIKNGTDLFYRPLAISRYLQNEILISGKHNENLLIQKFRDDLDLANLVLINPTGSDTLKTGQGVIINFSAINIEKVDLEFTTDNGLKWETVLEEIPSDQQTVTWKIPFVVSNKCKLRAVSSSDEKIISIPDSTFTIQFEHTTDYIAANQVKMWIGNDGMSSHNPTYDDAGFYWPGGEDARITSIFTDGILIGGKVNGEVRVHGANYRYGLTPGSINEDGMPGNPTDFLNQLFKIKNDSELLADNFLKQKYKFMYENWPVEKGAPWWDVNGDGRFTQYVDKPAMIGDEVLFYVANDLDSSRTKFVYGSPPVGLEFQTTVFASDDQPVEDAVFKKVKVINKSGKVFEDVYISYWTDDDLGYGGDDYVGCDTTLSLGYTYNGDNDDEFYYGSLPPAVGHLLIQGPKVRGMSGDSAFINNTWIYGYKNLEMTAYMFFDKSYFYSDADLGKYEGSLQIYNQMQGLTWIGESMIDPATNDTTTFGLSGDPVGKTGWHEGSIYRNYPPYDRRYLMSSGPFTMAPGDTQEVVFAIYMAKGSDRLNSVTKLKEKAVDLIDYYYNEIPKINNQNQNLFPNEFSISNNYPNPFNASTTIEFNLPVIEELGKTSLRTVVKVYDILGREVKTLLNKELLPGPHKIEFNGTGLASGVYLLRFEAEGRFQSIKKLMLLK